MALIVTSVMEGTALVVMLKLAVLLPEETVTVEGTLAMPELLLEREIVAPPVGALPVSVTVPST